MRVCFVCVFACMCVYMCIYMCVYMYTCVCVHVCKADSCACCKCVIFHDQMSMNVVLQLVVLPAVIPASILMAATTVHVTGYMLAADGHMCTGEGMITG